MQPFQCEYEQFVDIQVVKQANGSGAPVKIVNGRDGFRTHWNTYRNAEHCGSTS